MFLKPPFDSVPNLMRPVRGMRSPAGIGFKVPSSTEPSAKLPVTRQLVMVTILGGARVPNRRSS